MSFMDIIKKLFGKRRVKILVVDDEVDITDTVTRSLQINGYDAMGVNDGIAAMKQAKSWNPDLILLDLIMPSPDGFTVYTHLKRDPLTKSTPVIFMTAKSEQQIRSHAEITQMHGASFYRYHLKKPFATKELITKINALL